MPEQLTKNFTREEFACKGNGCCCHSAPISLELVDAIQRLRVLAAKPLTINSGFRCITHNAKIGGADDSQHCKGTAADIATPKGFTDEKFFELARQIPEFETGGMGIYDGRIHVDVRRTGGRGVKWDKRSTK